jgi:hypothetical protein
VASSRLCSGLDSSQEDRLHLLFHGTRSNAAASITRLQSHKTLFWPWEAEGLALDIASVTRKACLAAIEQGGLGWIVSPPCPVVVGLVALVPALIAECFLVRPHIVTVPTKEVSLDMVSFERKSQIRDQLALPCVVRDWTM